MRAGVAALDHEAVSIDEMNKHDLFWLAIKVAGLYLVVEGVRALPVVFSEGGLENQLGAYLPLVVGAILLGINLRSSVATADAAVSVRGGLSGMTRDEWFWVVCKALGVWLASEAFAALPWVVSSLIEDWGRTQSVVWMGIVLRFAVGLWLLFSNLLPRAVARRAASRGSATAETGNQY